MRIGLFGGATANANGPDVDSGQNYKDFIEYIVEAEALGFYSTFSAEHHFTGRGQVSATLSLLTWIGARTTTIRLGTAVLVLPWHNPVLVAEQVATIDLLSGGRVDLGVGKGYRQNEFRGFCIPQAEADARFDEAIELMIKSWTSKERFSHHGSYWHFDDIVVEPPTTQIPHSPLWIGAGSEASIRGVARRGCKLLLDQFCSIQTVGERINWYRDELERLGKPFNPMDVGVARAFFVASSAEEKEMALDRRMKSQSALKKVSQDGNGTNKASILTFADTREASEEATLFGSPDDIMEKIQQLRNVGVEYLLVNGGGTDREQLRSLARNVMPAFSA